MNHSTEVIDSLYFMGLKQALWAKEGYTAEVCVLRLSLDYDEYGLRIQNPGKKSIRAPYGVQHIFDRQITVIFVWWTIQQSERQQSDHISNSSPIQSGNPGSP